MGLWDSALSRRCAQIKLGDLVCFAVYEIEL